MPRDRSRCYIESKRKKRANGLIQRLVNDLNGYEGRCLFVVDANGTICGRPAQRRHIVPNAAVLSQLKDESSGKVMELGWHAEEWRRLLLGSSAERPFDLEDPSTFIPRQVGTNDACVRWFACDLHDRQFGMVDVSHPDFDDPMVRLASVYRPVLGALDLCSQRRSLHQLWRRECLRNASQAQRIHWIRETDNIERAYGIARRTSNYLGCLWHTNRESGSLPSNLIAGQVFRFRSALDFAASFFYGAGVAAVAYPGQDAERRMAVLYMEEQRNSVIGDYEGLADALRVSMQNEDYGVSVLKTLMDGGHGVIAVSPYSYYRLSDGDAHVVQRMVYDSIDVGGLSATLNSN